MKNEYVKSREIMQGSIAIAETIKAVGPGVISVYPITPQTHIVEHLARLVADGHLSSIYVNVDSEFSAASVIFGSVAAGIRSYTASSSQGLLLMTEVIFNMAGTRLPGVFSAVNRSVSPPVNIQVDHQDTMTLRDSGVIQIYVEDIQEAIDTHIQIFKIAEHKDILLPAMVCMDGWIISHAFEPVTLWKEEEVRKFVPPFEPVFSVDPENPLTYGSLTDDDKITEFKYMVDEALRKSKVKIKEVAHEFKNRFGNFHGDLVDKYFIDDAEIVMVAMGSVCGTIKFAIDELRRGGKKVGLLRIRSYRPFPDDEIRAALSKAKLVVIIDRSFSCSFGGILGGEIKSTMYGSERCPSIINFIIGIGGREINPGTIKNIIDDSETMAEKKKMPTGAIFYSLNKSIL